MKATVKISKGSRWESKSNPGTELLTIIKAGGVAVSFTFDRGGLCAIRRGSFLAQYSPLPTQCATCGESKARMRDNEEVLCDLCHADIVKERVEQAVDAALDNEAIECTREEREQFLYQQRAYDNAACYADMYYVSVDEFRKYLCESRSYDPTCRIADPKKEREQITSTEPYDYCPHCHSERRASDVNTETFKKYTTCLNCGYQEEVR